jgi:hypothetical protein
VRFLGTVHSSEIGELYRGAIAVLVPSLYYETFGLIAAEAFAHGTPAIARRIGALAEIVEQSGSGRLFATLEQCRDKWNVSKPSWGFAINSKSAVAQCPRGELDRRSPSRTLYKTRALSSRRARGGGSVESSFLGKQPLPERFCACTALSSLLLWS